jgi:hypothetical protein
VIFRALERVVCVLAIGLWWSSYALNAPKAIVAPRPFGESEKHAAPQSVTVDELQRILAESKDKPDAEVVRRLYGLELTEGMGSARLKSLEQDVTGKNGRWALVAMADASVFLRPTAVDVLPQACPDLNEQQHIIDLTVEYLGKTLPKLPNFYATRTTVRFDDGPLKKRARVKSQNDWRKVGGSKVVVAYRNGKEVIDPREWVKHSTHPEREGLITRGTFGPILSTGFGDAARGEMIWERWERGDMGTLAVFRYRVPQNQSHYSLGFHGPSSDEGDEEMATGYHGEVAIEPATGAILRITVEADIRLETSQILRADIMVEYGSVEIGGKTYTCPIRSVSICRFLARFPEGPEVTLLNDMSFTDYHQFRAESRILPGYSPTPTQ